MNNTESGNSTKVFTDDESVVCSLNDTTLTQTLKIISIFTVGGFGFFGNIFIIVLAIKYTETKNLHHLIINMAACDALIVLVLFVRTVPTMLIVLVKSIGDIFCKWVVFFRYFAMTAVFNSLVVITIQRFKATRATVHISRPYSLRQRMMQLVCIWTASMFFSLPSIHLRSYVQRTTGKFICKDVNIPIILEGAFLSFLVLSISLTVVLSAVTLQRLSHPQAIDASLSESQREARRRKMASAMKLVLSSLLLYAACYVPVMIWFNYDQIVSKEKNDFNFLCYEVYIFMYFEVFLPLINSCFSPAIYLIFMADFRKAAKSLIFKNQGIQNSVQQQQQRSQENEQGEKTN